MLEDFAKLFIKAFENDGLGSDDYFEKRNKRYREEVERGSVHKVHEEDWEPPRVYGKKRPRKTIEQKSVKDLVGELKRYATKNEA